jgi:hypothetical protein
MNALRMIITTKNLPLVRCHAVKSFLVFEHPLSFVMRIQGGGR